MIYFWKPRRKRTENERRFWLKNICEILTVVSADHEQVFDAVNKTNFKDFEDCLQDKCAQNAGADFIVTCNVKDFVNADTEILDPDELIALFE